MSSLEDAALREDDGKESERGRTDDDRLATRQIEKRGERVAGKQRDNDKDDRSSSGP